LKVPEFENLNINPPFIFEKGSDYLSLGEVPEEYSSKESFVFMGGSASGKRGGGPVLEPSQPALKNLNQLDTWIITN
jgi:hypothetical protein